MFQFEESWSIATLKHGGKEYIVRCNAWLRNIIGDPSYPYKVGIAILIKETDDNGFPAKTTNIKLGELEDLIINEMQKNKSFNYYHEGMWKTGYYDPISKLFVGRVGREIKTSVYTDQKYIDNLLKNTSSPPK